MQCWERCVLLGVPRPPVLQMRAPGGVLRGVCCWLWGRYCSAGCRAVVHKDADAVPGEGRTARWE